MGRATCPHCFSLQGGNMPDSDSDENEEIPIEANGFELTEKRKRQAEGRASSERLWNEIKRRLSGSQ